MRGQLSVQRELTKNLLMEVGYMYNKGIRLLVDHNLDGVPLQYLSTSPVRDQANVERMTANVANPCRTGSWHNTQRLDDSAPPATSAVS